MAQQLWTISSPLAALVRPPARHPQRWRAFVCRPSGRLCISTHPSATAALRSAHSSFTSFGCDLLRPSATVAAWQPGSAAPFRGKASIPPGVVSTGSVAAYCRDLPGFVSACVHPCPENGPSQISAHSPASTGSASFLATPDHASSFSSLTKCKMKQPPHPKRRAAVAAEARSNLCFSVERPLAGSVKKIIAVAPAALVFRPGSSSIRRQPARLVPRRSGSRLDVRKSNKLQKEAATAPEASGSGRCRCGATNYNDNLPADASAITSSYVM